MNKIPLVGTLVLLLQLCAVCGTGLGLQQGIQGLSTLLLGFKMENERCAAKVKHMLNQFLQDSSLLASFLNTGKGLNDLGDYETCSESPSNRYIMLTMKDMAMFFNLGICGPAECTAADYHPLRKPLAEFLNELIKSLTPKGTDAKIVIKENDVLFIDSKAEIDKFPYFRPGTIVTLLAVSVMILLSVGASVLTFRSPEIAKSSRVLDKLIYSFDLRRNADALMRVDQRHDTGLKVFDGIRVIGMLWVILGHSMMYGVTNPIKNISVLSSYLTEFSKAHLYNAFLAVDIFFFLSGFLLCFVLISSIATRFTWKLYLHRLIRLYPALIAAYCFYCYILPLFAQGPRFYNFLNIATVDCPEGAPSIFLFFYNFRNRDYNCLGWVWYVTVDMQMFIITPPIIYLLAKWPRAGLCTILALLVGSYTSTTIVAGIYNIYAAVARLSRDHSKYYYDMPYARIPPYLLGVLFAYWYVQAKKEKSLSQLLSSLVRDSVFVRVFCYIIGGAGVFFSIHYQYWVNKYYDVYGRWFDMSYLVGGRSVFIIMLFVLCLPSIVGKGRVMNSLLANPMMSILAKLTYGVYMIHQALLEYHFFSKHTASYVTYDVVLFWFWSAVSMAYIGAFLIYMFFEAPIFNMEDAFLRARGRPAVASEKELKEPLVAMKSAADSLVMVNKSTVTQS